MAGAWRMMVIRLLPASLPASLLETAAPTMKMAGRFFLEDIGNRHQGFFGKWWRAKLTFRAIGAERQLIARCGAFCSVLPSVSCFPFLNRCLKKCGDRGCLRTCAVVYPAMRFALKSLSLIHGGLRLSHHTLVCEKRGRRFLKKSLNFGI